jgi:hypothetical protein
MIEAAKGKPGGGGSVDVPVLFTNEFTTYVRPLADPDRDNPLSGGITSALMSLRGTLSGGPGSRVINATGAGTLTIHDVVPDQGEWARNCDADKEAVIRGLGLVDGALSGTFSFFTVDQPGQLNRFRLDGINIPGNPNNPWYVAATSSYAPFQATITEAENTLKVVQNFGELVIASALKSKNAPRYSCRAYWTVSVTLPAS